MCIIDNIVSILDEKKLKQSDMCAYIGINASTMTTWKSRKTDPPSKYIILICEFLQVSPYMLLTGHEKSSPTESLSEDQQRLLKMYSLLSDMEKGEILGELKVITKGRTITKEDNDSNIHTAYVAARSFDNHPPEIVTGDFSEILNAPDVTDKY